MPKPSAIREGGEALAKWRGQLPAGVYAEAGNLYGQMAADVARWNQPRAVFIQRALTCWEAALARGFVCC